MRRVAQEAVPALVCYVLVSAALWSWGGFLTDPRAARLPLLLAGAAVLVAGIAVRAGLPRWMAPVVQLVGGLGGVLTHLTGSPVPLAGGPAARARGLLAAAHQTFVHGFPPVHTADVAIVVLPAGVLAYVAADALAVTARRPAIAGVVILAVLGTAMGAAGGVPWPDFSVTAISFLALLALQESARVRRWGRPLEGGGAGWSRPQRGPLLVGATATALAVVLPLGLPAFHADLGGWGVGGDGPITVTNPMVGMYGTLHQEPGAELVHVSPSHGGAPAYLKIAVLNEFNGAQWSTGDRHIPTTQGATGPLVPPRPGTEGTDSRQQVTYSLTATDGFASAWLPVFDFPVSVQASDGWRYDTATYDFISADDSLTTAGQSWVETATPLDPSPQALRDAAPGTGTAPAVDTALPADFPSQITAIADRIAGDQPTPLQQGVALQRWFTTPGRFHYSLDQRLGDGSADLLSFLTRNRVGYCQQFATAMAAMARALGIPARVDVGFLHSHADGPGDYVFRGADMHAWPELWFQGVGWVRFDPTPGVGATAPAYTKGVQLATPLEDDPTPGQDPTISDHPSTQPSTPLPQRHQVPDQTQDTTTTTAQHHDAAWPWVVLALAVVVALAAAPWWVRRRRRSGRLDGGPEALWSELADTARDLRMPWADTESPRGQGRALRPYVLSVRGRASLDRIVLAVERARYARPGSPAAAELGLRPDAEAVIDDLEGGVSRGALRSAAILPPTVVGRSRVRRRLAATAAGRAATSDEMR